MAEHVADFGPRLGRELELDAKPCPNLLDQGVAVDELEQRQAPQPSEQALVSALLEQQTIAPAQRDRVKPQLG